MIISNGKHSANQLFNVGVPRSASTWICNALLKITSLNSTSEIIYIDKFDSFGKVDECRSDYTIIKSHAPDNLLRYFLKFVKTKIIISIRDPLDCVASLMEQFHFDFAEAINAVATSCESIQAIYNQTDNLLIKYENTNFRNDIAVRSLSEFIGLKITDEQAKNIASELMPTEVKKYISHLMNQGIFDDGPPGTQYDVATHWHPRHIGTGEIGKYISTLSEEQIAIVCYRTALFCKTFGYHCRDRLVPLEPSSKCPFNGKGLLYCETGFSYPEDWGIWAIDSESLIKIPMHNHSGILCINLRVYLGVGLRSDTDAETVISVNGEKIFKLKSDVNNTSEMQICIVLCCKENTFLSIKINSCNIKSPADLGISEDNRKLSLGIVNMSVDYHSMPEL